MFISIVHTQQHAEFHDVALQDLEVTLDYLALLEGLVQRDSKESLDLLDLKDHRVPRVLQDNLEVRVHKDYQEILEILVSRASEDLLVILDLRDLQELLVSKVSEGSQVGEAILDRQGVLVILGDKVGLVELERLEVLDSLDRTELWETLGE